jgi:glucose-1-phosphate adenylyltransferase
VFDDDSRRGQSLDSYICGGCVISGGTVRRSIMGQRCRVNSFSLVEDSILLEGANIGRNAKIRRAIIDEGVHIPDDSVIGYDHDADRQAGYTVTAQGIVVVSNCRR